MKRIGIVGYGYVGKAFVDMLADKSGYEVWIINRSPIDAKELPKNAFFAGTTEDEDAKKQINSCDLGVVCVPTPSKADGSCDTTIVKDVVGWLETPVILIKSTISPGTTDELKGKIADVDYDLGGETVTYKRVVFSPEYVGEGKYYVTPRMDFQTAMIKTPFFICGGDEKDCTYVFDLLVPVLGPEKTYYQCTALEAELIKYMENTYFGVKITFAQEMYQICQAFGANWYKVWQGWGLDPRVDIMHTAVFPESRGFSGKCLPKDLNALVKASMDKGYKPTMLNAMLESNAQFRPDEPVRVK